LNLNSQTSTCIICGNANIRYRHNWLFRCTACGFLSSALETRINLASAQIDEQKREYALNNLRRRNFESILDWLAETGLKKSALILEVGCGHGWFLAAARRRGYQAVGIEPDVNIAAMAQANGAAVRTGYFPGAIVPGEKFDAIVFNDVFEHLTDPASALSQVESSLAPSGLVAINLPLATGFIYRFADILDRVRCHGPLGRMWQLGFPSPHRSYFSAAQLSALAERHGFKECVRRSLPSLTVSGLWQRLRYDPTQSIVVAAMMWPFLVVFTPLLRFLPADIGVQIFVPRLERKT
jgi:SAM-dependent methyltransferase